MCGGTKVFPEILKICWNALSRKIQAPKIVITVASLWRRRLGANQAGLSGHRQSPWYIGFDVARANTELSDLLIPAWEPTVKDDGPEKLAEPRRLRRSHERFPGSLPHLRETSVS